MRRAGRAESARKLPASQTANPGEIVTALAAVSIHHVHDAATLERHVRAEPRLAQRQRHVVSRAEMFFEQGRVNRCPSGYRRYKK